MANTQKTKKWSCWASDPEDANELLGEARVKMQDWISSHDITVVETTEETYPKDGVVDGISGGICILYYTESE